MDQANKAINSVYLPYKHISLKGGKFIRSKLATAFSLWLNVNDHQVMKEYKELIEMLQNASLLIDDIEDGSLKRRGVPCAHLVYGVPMTINSGNFFYFLVIQRIMKIFPKDKVFDILTAFMEGFIQLHEGQAMDIYWRENGVVPTEKEYLQMIELKTGAFFRTIYLPLKIFGEVDLDLDKLCMLIGRYFQIKDDYINLKCDDFSKLKGFAEDISEGKFSFPLIYAIHKHPENDTILSILKMRTQDEELKRIVLEYLEEVGSFEYTKKVLDKLKLEILKELEKFKDNPHILEVLKMIFLESKIENKKENK